MLVRIEYRTSHFAKSRRVSCRNTENDKNETRYESLDIHYFPLTHPRVCYPTLAGQSARQGKRNSLMRMTEGQFQAKSMIDMPRHRGPC